MTCRIERNELPPSLHAYAARLERLATVRKGEHPRTARARHDARDALQARLRDLGFNFHVTNQGFRYSVFRAG